MVSSNAHGQEHHTSIWPFLVAVATGLAFGGLVIHLALTAFGVGLFVFAVGGWLHQDSRVRFGELEGPLEGHPFFGISTRKLGIWIFLASEIMFFTGILSNAFALRVRTEESILAMITAGTLPAGAPASTWAAPGQILNVPLTAVNTFILILSSFTMVEALKSAERGNQAAMKGFLLATFLLGATFVSIQAYEYQKLYLSEGLRPWGIDPALWAEHHGGTLAPLWGQTFGSTFYVQTGFHGAHVSGGVLALGFLTAKAFKGRYSAKNHEAIELVGLYWHFVDVVWIFLFTIVYLV